MPDFTVTMSRVLPQQFLFDVMTTWYEGGFGPGDWFAAEATRDDALNVIEMECADTEDVESSTDIEWVTVKPEMIGAAIQKVLANEIAVNETIYNYIADDVRDGDVCMIDAIASDVIVQIAVLGEVVYG